MNTNVLNAIKATTRLDQYEVAPFLLGQVSLQDWAKQLHGQTKRTAKGAEVSVLASATWTPNMQRALNALTLSVKLAVSAKQMSWLKASGTITYAMKRAELLMAHIAASKGSNDEMLFPLAGVRVKTEEGSFDAFQSGGEEPYTEEELLEMGWDWEQIEEFLDIQQATRDVRPEAPRTGEGSTSGGEGWYNTTLHTASQVADLQLNKLQFGEWMLAKALCSTVAWPTGDDWVTFLGRVFSFWEARVRIIGETKVDNDKKPLTEAQIAKRVADELEKQARREIDLQDLMAKPLHVRWTVNHLARRAWKDVQLLSRDLARYQGRVDELVQLDYLEERYGPDSAEFKAKLGRINMGEGTEQTRKALFLGYCDELLEQEVGFADMDRPHAHKTKQDGEDLTLITRGAPERRYEADGVSFVGTREVHDVVGQFEGGNITRITNFQSVLTDTPFAKEMAWANACVERCSEALRAASSMHKHLRAMDEALAALWEVAIEGVDKPTMPSAPPVYWNLKGFYLTEAAAQAALADELAESRAKRLLSQDDAILAAIAGLSGHELMA